MINIVELKSILVDAFDTLQMNMDDVRTASGLVGTV